MNAASSSTGLFRRTTICTVGATVVLPVLSVATAQMLNVPDVVGVQLTW